MQTLDLHGSVIRIVEMGSLRDMTDDVAIISGSCAFLTTWEASVIVSGEHQAKLTLLDNDIFGNSISALAELLGKLICRCLLDKIDQERETLVTV